MTPFGSFPFDAAGIDNFAHPQFIPAMRAPTSQDIYPAGTDWMDGSANPKVIYQTTGGGLWDTESPKATTTTYGTVILTDNSEPVATKAYADALVIAGAPVATLTVPGIGELASDTDATTGNDGGSTLLNPPKFVIPTNLIAKMSDPGAIGDVTAAAATFTGLTADGTGVVNLASSGDATISTATGSFVVSAGESAADAVKIESTAGGVEILASGAAAGEDIVITATGSSIRLSSTESAVDSINIESTAGGVKILASGASAGEDILLTATGSSIRLTATENVTDSINIESTVGGVNILASGASAGEDINITATGSSVNVNSTENAALAIHLHANGGTSETIVARADQGTGDASVQLLSDVGGVTLTGGKAAATAINFTTSDVGGGITMTAGTAGILPSTTGKFTVISTDNAAQAIELHANGGVTETIRIRSDQGTSATSLDLLSDVGGITLNAGLSTGNAITMNASGVAGGFNIDAGTGGFILDTTGNFSLDGVTASNVTVTGAAVDLTVSSAGGSVVITGTEAAVDAIQLNATTALGGIDVNAGTGGMTIDSGGLLSIDSAGTTNLTTTGAFDLTVQSTAGSVILSASEDVADAIQILSTAGGMAITATGAAAQDISIQNNGGSVNIGATENAALAISVLANGGTSETVVVRAAQGTGAASVQLLSTAGGVTLTGGKATANAINLTCSDGAGGITCTAGSGGLNVTGATVVTGNLSTTGDLAINTSGKKLTVKAGAATDFAGNNVLTAGTVTINNTNIATGDLIFIQRIAPAASVTTGELTYTISNGVSFTVTSVILGTPGSTQTADVSTFAYFIVRPT